MGEYLEYFLLQSYVGALLWIAFGIWIIRFVLKNPTKMEGDSQGGDMKGWAAGIFSIGGGITIIILKLLGKL
ncbi:MAG: hypothetical protein J0M08_10055 [Bacteroidetes bacterium]|nr:hypothetical protein [Bacteroidota bacterium]